MDAKLDILIWGDIRTVTSNGIIVWSNNNSQKICFHAIDLQMIWRCNIMSKIMITEDDFNLDELSSDDVFMELFAGEGNPNRAGKNSGAFTCNANPSTGCLSLWMSLTSLMSKSDPANTYTELGCC